MTRNKKIILSIILFIPSYFFIKFLIDNLSWECPVLKYTGFYCPGCGMTRAFRMLLVGNVLGALKYNLLAPFLLIALMYFFIKFYCVKILELNLKFDAKKVKIFLTFSLFILIFFGILRNI